MRELPLYDEMPVSAVEAETPLTIDKGCSRCELSGLGDPAARSRPISVCVSDEGDPGGVLLVGEGPGVEEDKRGRPFCGRSGDLLRPLVAKWYQGPVALSNAMRCRPVVAEVDDKHVDACRGYLARTIEEVNPERIVALGAWAAYSLTGRSVSPLGARGGYTYLASGRYERSIPVFFVTHPAAALRNRFVLSWFKEDLERALTCPRPKPPPLDEVVRVVETAEDAERAVAEIGRWPWASLDGEWCGLLFDKSFRLLCLSVTPERDNDDESVWSWDEAALNDPAIRRVLARYLADPTRRKTGSNVKADVNALITSGALGQSGFVVRGMDGDVRLWRKLLDPDADGTLAKMVELVGMGGMKDEQKRHEAPLVKVIKFGVQTENRLAKAQREGRRVGKLSPVAAAGLRALADLEERLPYIAEMARNPDVDWEAWSKAVVPDDVLIRYNARDTLGTRRLCSKLPVDLAAVPPIDRIRRLVVDRAARAAQKVEAWGMPVDMDALREFDGYCALRLGATRMQLDKVVGPTFNPGSHPQLAALLFDKLHLKVKKTTKAGKASTDEEVLEGLRGKHPVVDLVLDHRKYSKLQSNYAGGMIKWVMPDGRVHCSILLDGAKSGRASIQDPPLQTLPSPKRDPDLGRACRDIFAVRPGKRFVQFDYKQVEFRVAAMLSRDPVMIADILAGVDAHMMTARAISKVAWGIPPEAVTEQHRAMAKTTTFGTLYGKTPHGLAAEFGCSVDKAEAIYNAVMGRFKVLAAWIKRNLREAQKTGYAWTSWAGEPARRRALTSLADPDEKRRTHAENACCNHPVQGGANEFQLASLAAAVEWIEDEGIGGEVKLVLPVHDSLLFEVDEGMVDETVRVVKGIMTGHDSQGIPLDVDCEVGGAWGSLTKYKGAS